MTSANLFPAGPPVTLSLDALLRTLVREELGELLDERLDALEHRVLASLSEHLAGLPATLEGPEPLLKLPQVAGLLQIDERSVRRMVAAGELPEPLRVGTRPRWRRADLPGFAK